MVEALGIGASAVGLLGVVIQVAERLVRFGLNLKDAPENVKNFMSELQSLERLLIDIRTNLLYKPDFKTAFENEYSALLSSSISEEGDNRIGNYRNELQKLLMRLRGLDGGHRLGWKRVKATFMTEHLERTYPDENASIAYVYCDYKDRENQNALSLLSSLTRQLALQLSQLPLEVHHAYSKSKDGEISISLKDCSDLFLLITSRFTRSFILIDALDENVTQDKKYDGQPPPILARIDSLLQQNRQPGSLSFLITSRERNQFK